MGEGRQHSSTCPNKAGRASGAAETGPLLLGPDADFQPRLTAVGQSRTLYVSDKALSCWEALNAAVPSDLSFPSADAAKPQVASWPIAHCQTSLSERGPDLPQPWCPL